jgi:hypothetical protein
MRNRSRIALMISLLVAAGVLLAWGWSQQRADGDSGTSGASAQREPDLPVAQPANQAPTQEPVANSLAQEPPPLLVDPARVTGHRASPAQRAEYRRRVEQDLDLKALERDLQPRAANGEADAAAALADLYLDCAAVLRYPPPQPSVQTEAPPPTPPHYQRCAGFGVPGELTALNLRATGQTWRRTAAALGDTLSQYIGVDDVSVRPGSAEFRVRQSAAEELLRRGEFSALLDYSNQLWPLTGLNVNHAWIPVLCGLVNACESDSCRSRCNLANNAVTWRQLAPREQRECLGQQTAILAAIRNNRFDGVWRQEPKR